MIRIALYGPHLAAPRRIWRWALACWCLLHSAGATETTPAAGDAFREGNRAYLAGDYVSAVACFEAQAIKAPAAGTLHNLGNSYWKCARTGEAILAWERAQWLDPYCSNARANLRYARKTASLEAPELSWLEVYSSTLPVDGWAWMASASVWLALGSLLIPGIFRWRKTDWHQAFAAIGFAAFLLTLPALVGVHTRARFGVILPKQAVLRLTPTQEAQMITRLNGGEMARLERERGDYLYVRLGNEAAGWVRRAEFGRIDALAGNSTLKSGRGQ